MRVRKGKQDCKFSGFLAHFSRIRTLAKVAAKLQWKWCLDKELRGKGSD
jgi:hypothetical protein